MTGTNARTADNDYADGGSPNSEPDDDDFDAEEAALVEAGEALAKAIVYMGGSGEDRPGQRAMCEAVAEAIAGGRHLVVAAGTGTGKSMGYLAPLVASGRKAVIATATKALQDQLVNKDLPLLSEALCKPIRYTVLKGRSNYLCKQKLVDSTKAARSEQGELIAADSADEADRVRKEIARLAAWSHTTVDGDRAGLPFEPSVRAWEQVSVSGRECPGANKCPSGAVCFAEQAKAGAEEADVVVVNTHLYCLGVFTPAAILPEHDVAVFDEAHTIEDIAASAAGVALTGGRFTSAARAIKAAVPKSGTAEAVEGAGRLLRDALIPHRDALLATLPTDIVDAAVLCRSRIDAAAAEIREASGGNETRLRMALNSVAALAEDLAKASGANTENAVWVEGSDRNPVWRTAPVDVGPHLANVLWESTPSVLTSATIPIGLAATLGIAEDTVDVIDVGSPFDYDRSGLLYCAKHLPNPNAAGRDRLAHEEIARLATAAGGRTLALFTSYAAMDRAAEAISAATELTVYTQRDYPKQELLRRFTHEEASCLFATMGMWQGVDVPGRSLSLVVVDRIPFPRPDEPLMSARRELCGSEAFAKIDVPRAATMLAQGIGRLIRTRSDSGVVAVLDSRLATARYRWDLIRSLPPFRRTSSLDEAADFLADISRSADADAV